jgi:transposase
MRGVQFTTAVGMLAELGDLERFQHPRQLMAWLGITPSEYSSGSKRSQGGITKTGNSYARKLLIEAAWSYRHAAHVSREIQVRQDGLPKPPIDRAWQLRLCRHRKTFLTREERQHHSHCRSSRTGRIRFGYRSASDVARFWQNKQAV